MRRFFGSKILGFVPGWLALALVLGGTAIAAGPPVFNGAVYFLNGATATFQAASSGSMKIYQGDSVNYPHQLVFADANDGTVLATLGDNTTTGDFKLLRSTGTFSGQEISFNGINCATCNTYPYVEHSGGSPDGLNFIVPTNSQYAWRFITRNTDTDVTVRAQIDASGNSVFNSVAAGSGAITTQGAINLSNNITGGGKVVTNPFISNDLAAINGVVFNVPTDATYGWRFEVNGGSGGGSSVAVPLEIFPNGTVTANGALQGTQLQANSAGATGLILGTANQNVSQEILIPNPSAMTGSTHQTAIGTSTATVQSIAGSLLAISDNGATNATKFVLDTGGNGALLGTFFAGKYITAGGVQPDTGSGGYAPEYFIGGAAETHPRVVTGSCSTIATTGTSCTFPNAFAFPDSSFTCQLTASGSTAAYFSYDTKTTTGFKAYSNSGTPSADYSCSD